jgi:hypothetical protein
VSRGPSGRAPVPPSLLNSIDLPLEVIAAGAPLARVHRLVNDPIFFGPGAGMPPTYRFDSPAAAFGVLYVGVTLPGALVETLLRNPRRKMTAYDELASRASSDLRCSRALRLVRLHGDGLQRVGCDNAISTGPYDVCGAWADALWRHPAAPDGIVYQSRHDPGEICVAIFQRLDLGFSTATTTRLIDQLPAVSSILGRYGKSITSPPR